MRRTFGVAMMAVLFGACALAIADDGDQGKHKVVEFTTMYGVDGPFINNNSIRGVLGDELPWTVGQVSGSLRSDGRLHIEVHGLVFSDDPSVPVNLRGINDEDQFRALVSCLTDGGGGTIATVNFTTGGFASTKTGDSHIDARIALPKQCVAPIVFILSGSEDKWFAVTGAESGN